jgi:DNA-binding LytR/AlgR family response regulator
MSRVTALIADDEAELRSHLIRMLEQLWPELTIIGEAGNGLEALNMANELSPDIVFLDIRMPGLNGIEVARQICGKCLIVFITAYDQYAIDAFENEALDYILKPVEKKRLQNCIQRCHCQVSEPVRHSPDLEQLLGQLEKRLDKDRAGRYLQWIRAQHGDAIRLIPVEEVLMFRSADKYTLVITLQKESVIRKTIKELEKELDPEKFWKIHRGSIVNVSCIQKVSKSMTGKYVLKLNGFDEPLMVSRSYSHLFKQM